MCVVLLVGSTRIVVGSTRIVEEEHSPPSIYVYTAGDQGQMDRSIVVKVPDEGMCSMSRYSLIC